MDIGSGKGYPASALSNFSPYKFVFDGVECNSMEGLLQSFKFSSVEMQIEVCKLVGKQAKFRGKGKKWYRKQKLYWQGVEYDRASDEYQMLLDRAYAALSSNTKFQQALIASGNATLRHSSNQNTKFFI